MSKEPIQPKDNDEGIYSRFTSKEIYLMGILVVGTLVSVSIVNFIWFPENFHWASNQDRETIKYIHGLSCEELWKYHTDLFCSVRTGCSHNDRYVYAGELYQKKCK